MNIRMLLTSTTATIAFVLTASAAIAQDDGPVLFSNVDVFDGETLELMQDMNVVVTDNLITQVTADDVAVAGGQVIDGEGYTLMPGLSDTHVHIAMASLPIQDLLVGLPGSAYINSVVDAEKMLMRGVTSVRDMGGDTFALKQAIDSVSVVSSALWITTDGSSAYTTSVRIAELPPSVLGPETSIA